VRQALLLALACSLPWLAGSARADDDEPNAPQLAINIIQTAFAGDVSEIWRSDWGGTELQIGVARHWEANKPKVRIQVLAPHKYDTLAYLIQTRPQGGPGFIYYRSSKLFPPGSQSDRATDLEVASPIERLPFVPAMPATMELWPMRLSDYGLKRLPDSEMNGKPCRVLEWKLRRSDGDYDRIVTTVAHDSNIAFDTQYLRGNHLVRRVTVLPTDIDHTGSRPVIRRRTIERPGDPPQVFTLESFSLDPVFPDEFFTSSNLRTGRFPSY
jgi:hypothetical protein